MGAYMKKNEVLNFLTNMDEEYYSPLITSISKAKGDDNIDISLLENLFVKHLKGDAASLMTNLESEVVTYQDSEYFDSEEDFAPFIDTPLLESEEDDFYDGDLIEF